MPISADEPAPYAPAHAVLTVINKFRDHGLVTPITYDVLARIGISESLQQRTLAAIKTIDLLDEAGDPTPDFKALQVAPSDEYEDALASHIRSAYEEVFSFVDPAQATYEQVFDAFRVYNPASQRARMTTLFLGLCEEAGIIDSIPQPDRSQKENSSRSRRKSKAPADPSTPDKSEKPPPLPKQKPPRSNGQQDEVPGLHPALQGLLSDLPQQGQAWNEDARNRFTNAFDALLDLYYPAHKPKNEKQKKQADMFEQDE